MFECVSEKLRMHPSHPYIKDHIDKIPFKRPALYTFSKKLRPRVKTIKFTFLLSPKLLGVEESFLIKALLWVSPFASFRGNFRVACTLPSSTDIEWKWFAAFCLQLSSAFFSISLRVALAGTKWSAKCARSQLRLDWARTLWRADFSARQKIFSIIGFNWILTVPLAHYLRLANFPNYNFS